MIVTKYGLNWVLDGRGDEYILNENNYRCIFDSTNITSLRPDDIWLDVGAHFGSFALRAAQRVQGVVAVEPAPDNFQQLLHNIRLNQITNVVSSAAAVIGRPTQQVNLALGRTFDYTHRVGHIRGRQNIEVLGTNINELVERYKATKIKMDCEGSEYELLVALDYRPIQEIILEWHFTLIPDVDWVKLRAMIKRLEAEGLTIRRAPVDLENPTKRWTAIIWAVRE